MVFWASINGHGLQEEKNIETWFACDHSDWYIWLRPAVHNVDELRQHLSERASSFEKKGQGHNPIIAPWWTPGFHNGYEWYDKYPQASWSFGKATLAASYSIHHQKRIDEIQFALDLILGNQDKHEKGLFEAYQLLSSLDG